MPARLLASNARQARKLRVLTWSFTALAVAACIWPFFGDPAAFVLAPIGVLVVAALHVYTTRYVTKLELDGDMIVVQTAAFGSPVHRFAVSRIGPRVYHVGPGRYGTHSTDDAPWITLPIEGVRWPFVIDAQIEVLDLAGIKAL